MYAIECDMSHQHEPDIDDSDNNSQQQSTPSIKDPLGTQSKLITNTSPSSPAVIPLPSPLPLPSFPYPPQPSTSTSPPLTTTPLSYPPLASSTPHAPQTAPLLSSNAKEAKARLVHDVLDPRFVPRSVGDECSCRVVGARAR